MRKIFLLLFLYFLFISTSHALKDFKIISREEWGANEEYIFLDSDYWQDILKKREGRAGVEPTDKQKQKTEKRKQINEILLNNYGEDNKISETIYELNGRKLAWPIHKSEKIRGIVIHHTYSEYEDSNEGIKQIYKYHAINREWGDIGYNYIIGYDGEIFEGRAGGDSSVGAHVLRNNRQTLGISLMGNYSDKGISKKQYDSLLKLTNYLVKKHKIDLSSKTFFHKECISNNCELPLISEKMYPIIGHRDAGYTSCPGEELYKEIAKVTEIVTKKNLSIALLYKKKMHDRLEKIGEKKLIEILLKLEKTSGEKLSKKSKELKSFILNYFDKNSGKNILYSKNKYIKIKLSYPNNKKITLSNGGKNYEITRYGNEIRVNGKIEKAFTIKAKKDSYVEVVGWNRIPKWDKTKKYNDNKFRGALVVYPKNKKLVVVNRLKVEDYLKGLGEVSNNEHPEKIKSIIIAARTYALWYTKNEEKFPGEWYNGSDDPGVFQKYLGYSLEERTPKVSKVVDETKGKVLTYNNKLIKPWYFSSSNGKTLSFYDYCVLKYDSKFCLERQKKYPYLKSVVDYGGVGKEKKGHGVGMPGTGVSYFAEKGWNAEVILKYFYPGVDI